MSRLTALLFAVACLAAGLAASASSAPPALNADPVQHGQVLAHGNSAAGHLRRGGGGTPLLTWHSGAILAGVTPATAIYWGPSWSNATFAGDKVGGLDTFYSGVGGSSYIGTTTEYTGTNGQVAGAVTGSGHVLDPTATSSRAPSTTDILNVVARNFPHPATNGYYAVYSDQKRGSAGYCAWHSYGTINGTPVEFAFFFNLDGDPGCDPGDTSGLHSQGLAALANVSGHELSETVTDPSNGGWWDRNGAENADKCAWTFNGLESFGNGSQWLIQGNFSNKAYATLSGYDHGGCVNGN